MVRKVSPSNASPVFSSPPHTLPDQARRDLLALLGYSAEELDAAAYPGYRKLPSPPGAPLQLVRAKEQTPLPRDPHRATLDIESALGFYEAGLLHLNQIPGPTDYQLALLPVRDLAASALNQIGLWSGYYRDQFKLRSVDLGQIEIALAKLADTTNAILKSLPADKQRGRRTDRALTECIRRLRIVFRDFYVERTTEHKRRIKEVSFVKRALAEVKVLRTDVASILRHPNAKLEAESKRSRKKPKKKVAPRRSAK